MSNRTVITVSLNQDEKEMFAVAREKVLQDVPKKFRDKYTNSEIMKMVLDSFLVADSQNKVS